MKYYDINHDGHIDDNDKVDLGNGMPDWTFGFSLGFDYKGLDFSVTANAMTGNKIVQTYRNVGVKTSNYTTEISTAGPARAHQTRYHASRSRTSTGSSPTSSYMTATSSA